MRIPRNHIDAPLRVGEVVDLPDSVGNHVLRVLRLAPGSPLVLFNGDGADYDARLLSAGKRGAQAELLARRELANESPLRLRLLQAVARGEKMDWVLQKATELGVSAIDPLFSERTEVKLDAERSGKRRAHWQGVIAAACEQSGRACLPRLGEALPLDRCLAQPLGEARLLLDPVQGQAVSELALPAAGEVVLAVGPEGGWSPRDLAQLGAAGFRGVRLGPRVLRTETAGLAALAALQAIYGDWR